MKKMQNCNGKINVIIVLLIVVVFLALILLLEVSGKIKIPKKDNSKVNTNEKVSSGIPTESFNSIYMKKTNNNYLRYKILKLFNNTFFIYIIAIGLNIGICKLYQKLNLPSYVIIFTFIWPIFSIISRFLPYYLASLLSDVDLIISLMALCYYFKAVGMSFFWGILPTISSFLLFGGILAMFLTIKNNVIVMSSFIGFAVFIIAFVISNIKLGKMFQKSTLFIVGLALFPFIFQPILGYSNDSIS